MYYTGIDLHKSTSYLTTVDSLGKIVKQQNIKNVEHNFVQYFSSLTKNNIATVESTMTWYWLDDLLTSLNISLVLAHAKYVKAIAYAKVKTDKVDSQTLAQLLRMDYIPKAHKISKDNRMLRDALRARLKNVQRHTSITNSMQLLLSKYNFDSPTQLSGMAKYQYDMLTENEILLSDQITDIEKQLHPFLIPNEDIQRLLRIPGIGIINAFSIFLEVDDILRFPGVNNFISYSRLSPSARNSGGKTKQISSKAGNKYLKIVFSNAAVRAIQFYPVIRKYHASLLRKKNKHISKTLVAKEIAKIVFFVLKKQTDYNNKFKGMDLEHTKSLQWPRVINPVY